MLHCCEIKTIYCHIKAILKIIIVNWARVGWNPPQAGGKAPSCGFPRKIHVPASSPRAAPAARPSHGRTKHLCLLPGAEAINPFPLPPHPHSPSRISRWPNLKIISQCLISFPLPCRACRARTQLTVCIQWQNSNICIQKEKTLGRLQV